MARSHAVGAAQSRLKELCVIASEATGVSFTPLPRAVVPELAEEIRHGEVGIAWMPPIPAIELEEDGAATPLALPWRHESASYYSALVTREGRAKGVAELQGMRVAWVDKESAAGYLVPRMHLASLGLDARTFFAHETFAHSHLGVIDAVVSGAADVGATFCTLEPGTKRVHDRGVDGGGRLEDTRRRSSSRRSARSRTTRLSPRRECLRRCARAYAMAPRSGRALAGAARGALSGALLPRGVERALRSAAAHDAGGESAGVRRLDARPRPIEPVCPAAQRRRG